MTISLARTAGFCFGVTRAVKICRETAETEGKCKTLGPIIHNTQVVDFLAGEGAVPVNGTEDVLPSDTVVIRSHGITERELHTLESVGCRIVDATCPFVARIHEIVKTESKNGSFIFIVGSADHPEVLGIASRCSRYAVVKDVQDLKAQLEEAHLEENVPIVLVSQTTGNKENFEKCAVFLKKVYTNPKVFDTICNTTSMRQKEAAELSSVCSVMVVIGGRGSANTLRLTEICREHCSRVYQIETAAELKAISISPDDSVGITAGASTPSWIIKEVKQKMSEEIKEMNAEEPAAAAAETVEPAAETESFEEMLEKSIRTLQNGDKVTGIVAAISPTEISVDLGTKHAGYIPLTELSADPNVKPEDILKVGDEVEAFVTRVNDVEGTVALSKKRLDAVKSWDIIEELRANKETVEGLVIEENKGGVVVSVKGIRVFVPASQTGIPKDQPMTDLLKQNVKLRITEVNQSRRRVVGSIRAVAYEERKAKAEAVWNEIEVGKKYTGTVKSMTSYGAFVDIGGIDGMVHVSEISWTRIQQPSDVLAIGDEIEVYVINFDKEKRKISLGCKTEENSPWNKFVSSVSAGDVVDAKIVKLMPFGAFAEIIPGVDGLIHISQIADRRIATPAEVLSEGQEVQVKVTEINEEKHKVSLSIRALLEAAPEVEAEAAEEDAE